MADAWPESEDQENKREREREEESDTGKKGDEARRTRGETGTARVQPAQTTHLLPHLQVELRVDDGLGRLGRVAQHLRRPRVLFCKSDFCVDGLGVARLGLAVHLGQLAALE